MRKLALAATLVGALMTVSPSLATAGSISGAVSDEVTQIGIAGIQVCANPNPYNYEGFCTESAANGAYQIVNLPSGNYSVRFASYREELNYVAEWNGGDQQLPGDLVAVGSGDVSGIDAELEAGGILTGTLTDAETGGPAAGAWACVENESIFFGICLKADANGHYEVNRLATAEYRVRFEGDNEANYLTNYYDGTEVFSQAKRVAATAGATVAGIDGVLNPGAQILGHVTEVRTGLPAADAFVCAMEPAPGDIRRCAFSDEAGNYAIRSLRAGTYLVSFGYEPFSFGPWSQQWWEGASSAAEATPVAIVPPQARTGIDGQVEKPIWPPAPESEPAAATSAAALPITAPEPRLRKCRKGFHRKLVKGKKRCVRKQRHQSHRRHQHHL